MKPASYKDNIPRMAEYRIEHSYRVAHIGAEIAKAEGLDEERTVIACLLHDIGYSIDFVSKEDYRNHGRYSAKLARPFLLSLGFSKNDTEEMCYGIAIHADDQADFDGERTPLALTVGDADNIDRFDAYRLLSEADETNRNKPQVLIHLHQKKIRRNARCSQCQSGKHLNINAKATVHDKREAERPLFPFHKL